MKIIMIIKKWNKARKVFPYEQKLTELNSNTYIEVEYKGLRYYTANIADYFSMIGFKEFEDIVSSADINSDKEVDILLKYNELTPVSARIIRELHKYFFFYQGIYFNKNEVRTYISANNSGENTFIISDKRDKDKKLEINKKKQDEFDKIRQEEKNVIDNIKTNTVVEINRQAIRNITGYSYKFTPIWSNVEITNEWQRLLLDDHSDLVLLDASRQIGKSLTIAELIIELSFIPLEDTLVAAFIKKTTDVIRNYMLRYIKKFNNGIFEIYKADGVILNVKSGTKIYFRTLDDGGENIRGLTLRNIVIDEAQLINDVVFEEILEPTLSSTGGRMYLIGTASKHKKYFYKKITQAKESLGVKAGHNYLAAKYTNEYGELVSYYRLDLYINKIINPKLKAKILANKDKSSYKREWFCDWNSDDDIFINYKSALSDYFPKIDENGYCVITFDPAKSGKDRSAFCIEYVFNGVIYILQSGFVPDGLKNKWSTQIKYYKKHIIDVFNKKGFKKVIYGVDIRGIGEGFTNEWEHQIGESIIKIGYTSGEKEKLEGFNWRVSKSILLTNVQDIFDENKIVINSITNKDLIGELDTIYEDVDRYGKIAIKSDSYDDIFNALATNLFIINRKGLLKRATLGTSKKNKEFDKWNKEFKQEKHILTYKKNRRLI